jgi:TonB family protein
VIDFRHACQDNNRLHRSADLARSLRVRANVTSGGHCCGQGCERPRRFQSRRRSICPKSDLQSTPDVFKKGSQSQTSGNLRAFLVVGTDGKPHDVRVVRMLGLGLDEEAIKTVKEWTFEPALKDGQSVPVQINVEVNFRLY